MKQHAMKTNTCLRLIPLMILFRGPVQADPLSTAFTYQGRLQDGTNAATGLYDLRFLVYDSDTGGIPVGAQIITNGVPVTNGLFTVILDFGQDVFGGSALAGHGSSHERAESLYCAAAAPTAHRNPVLPLVGSRRNRCDS